MTTTVSPAIAPGSVDDRRAALVDKAKYVARRALHAAGLDVHRTHGSLAGVRNRLSERNGVSVVFDVGANRGQYAWELRAGGYRGRICSFEPFDVAFAVLEARAAKDDAWDCFRMALSDRAGGADLHISANSMSSSLLPMADAHVIADPHSEIVGVQQVPLATLDDVAASLSLGDTVSYGLKIDTQGHEWAVLDGATDTLRRCVWVEVELSLEELYVGQRLMPDLMARLDDAGFRVAQMEPVFSNPETGQLLQVNGLFRAGSARP